MRVTVIGAGAVGGRVVEALAADPDVESLTVVHREPTRLAAGAEGWGGKVHLRRGSAGERPDASADVTVLAGPASVRRSASAALDAGSHVVCVVDDPIDVRHLLEMDDRARRAGRYLVVGTAMAPGLSCALSAFLAPGFDSVDEIHVASLGTGGPACARRHHAALAGIAVDWADGTWRRRAGGSGRELVWFPEPVGGADCYRAALADPLVLAPAFPNARRITARLAATRRDRLTSWLPMLRPPHPEGLVGAVRVEMRGWVGGRPETRIVGAATPPAVASAAVTTTAVRWAATGRLARPGAAGLAELVGPSAGSFVHALAAAGVAVSAFEGGLA
jgi:saccharopine dehydrogenase-like NADP-dependent oxidoreductase